jgi:ATP-binding cassette subfamily C protein CydD
VHRLGPAFVVGRRAGELVRTTGEGPEALDGYVTRYRPARLLAAIVPLIVSVLILVIDPWSVVVLILTGPVLVWLLSMIGKRIGDAAARREGELTWMSAHFLDVIRGLPTLKMFGRSREQAVSIEQIGRRYGTSTMAVLKAVFQTSLVLEWGAVAATALVAIEVSVRLMNDAVTFERALAVLLLTPEFFVPLRRLAAEHHARSEGLAAATGIISMLDERSPMRAGGTRPVPDRLDIRFEDVSLTYEDGARRALAGCSLHIPAGGRVALVGATGAGKSSIANLLLGFVCQDRGTISVDGEPLDDIDMDAWRRSIAWVPQHPSLTAGTVADNLLVAKAEATEHELWEALAYSHADGFVRALPARLDTPIGEGGVRLSGGQRQRLAIARALVRDAPLMILDEATSHLDDEIQAAVIGSLLERTRGRTVISIAHQLELAATADLILVIEDGHVVETGTPAELSRSGSAFQRLAAGGAS